MDDMNGCGCEGMLIAGGIGVAVAVVLISISAIMGKIFGDMSWCVGPLCFVAICVAAVLAIIAAGSMPPED